jgi:predicted transcriptional regulator
MSTYTLAERLALYYVSKQECALMRELRAAGETYKEIQLQTGRVDSTINRHINGECTHD